VRRDLVTLTRLACASDGQATLSLHKNARVPSAAARLEFDDQVICWNPWHASDGTLQARADFGLLRPAPGWASEADAEQGQTGSNGLQSCSSILHAYPVSPSLYLPASRARWLRQRQQP
jgi:hypothetical protein